MSRKRRPSPQQQWEQALVDDYYDYRWRQVLDPLYEELQRWKAGERTHDDMDSAIHEAHEQTKKLYTLFTQNRSWLARAIQMDREWFERWLADHPPPPGAPL